MPYNPGVSDQSGQFLGQGILGAAQALSGGYTQYKLRDEENKKLESENKALELITKSAATSAGLPPELIDQAVGTHVDETPRSRNARLKTTLSGVLQKQQVDEQSQKQKLMAAEVAQMEAKHQEDLRNSSAAAMAVRPRTVLPDPAAVGAAFNAGAPVPSATTTDTPTADESMRTYLAEGGNDPRHAQMLIAAAKPVKPAVDGPKVIDITDENGVKRKFTWDPVRGTQAVKPSADKKFAPDVAEKVQTALELAQQDLEEAQASGDARAAAAAQARVTAYGARLKNITAPKGDKMVEALKAMGLDTAPGKGAAAPGAAAGAKPTYKSADEVKAALKAGTLKRDEALKILQSQFGYK